MARRVRTIPAVIAALCLAACAETDSALPEPPVPEGLQRLDPAIAARVEAALETIRSEPDDVEHRVRLGMIYAANSLDESARRRFEQAVAERPGDAQAWYWLAETRGRLGDAAGALAAARRAADLAPDYAPAHWRWGQRLLDADDLDAAEAAFDRALAADPTCSAGALGLARVHLRRGEHARAAEILEHYLGATDRNAAHASFLLGTAYRGLGRAEEAAEALRRGAGAEPVYHDPWTRRLAAYAEGYQAELERAKAKAAGGDLDAAIVILNRLKRDRNATVEVYNNLAFSYLANEQPDQALAVLEEGIALNPGSLEANHLLAGTCWLISGDAPPAGQAELRRRAREHVARALEINPAYVPALGLRGDIAAAGGELVAAVEAYREAAKWQPENPEWPYQTAMALARLRRWGQAAAALEQVTGLEPAYKDAMGRLGLAYMSLGRADDAERALTRALSLNPGYEDRIEAALRQVREGRARGAGPP